MKTAYRIFAYLFLFIAIGALIGVLTGAWHQLAIMLMSASMGLFFYSQSKPRYNEQRNSNK